MCYETPRGPLVIKVEIGPSSIVERVAVDSGSFIDVLYYNTCIKMGYKKEDLSPSKEVIYGFTNTTTLIARVIDSKSSIRFRLKKGQISQIFQFIVVVGDSYFNIIVGRQFIHKIKVVSSSNEISSQ